MADSSAEVYTATRGWDGGVLGGMADFKVFISGVTSEVGAAREKVAARLRELKLETKEQKDFTHGLYSDTTLKLLHDYIVDCAAVVCIIGKRSGDKPSPKASAPFARMLPEGFAEASYTQWEWLFALHYERPLLIFYASDDFKPDQPAPNGPDYFDLQEAYRDYLFKKLGRYRKPFSNVDQLCDEVLKVNWGALWITHGWSQEKVFAPFLEKRREFFFGRDWLFNEIKTWQGDGRQPERMMLVTGMPGAGKSAFVARFLKKPPCGRVLAYHCFMYTEEKTATLDGFVRNVSSMLADRVRSYREVLARPAMKEEREYLDKSAEDGPKSFFKNAIFTPLQGLAKPTEIGDGPGWIVVDALDEAAADPEKRRVLDELIRWALQHLPPWLRILATSRRDDMAEELAKLFEDGLPLVRPVALDDESRPEDEEIFRQFIAARLKKGGKEMPAELQSLLLQRSEYNFLYLTHVLDGYVGGTYRLAEISTLPQGLTQIYAYNFERLYPRPSEPEFSLKVKPLLAALVAARRPLPSAWIPDVVGISANDLRTVLARLKPYLTAREQSYSMFHKSFADWLLDPTSSPSYTIDAEAGHRLLAVYCRKRFAVRRSRIDDVSDLQRHEDWQYLVRYGIDHFVQVGFFADAVDFLQFIRARWDEQRMSKSTFRDVSPHRFTRNVLRALDECPEDGGKKINPLSLAPLLTNFYQVEPLKGPVRILIRDHSDRWPGILKGFLEAGNYVLRYVISEEMADALYDDDRDETITIEQIHAYLEDPDDVTLNELGAYTLRNLYGRGQGSLSPAQIARLEQMGEGKTYAPRSALGDLLVNLAVQGRFDRTWVKSPLFWQPIWDHNRIDVWDINAASSFVKGQPLAPDADEGTRSAYVNFERTRSLTEEILSLPGIESDLDILDIVEGFADLGRNPDRIGEAAEALDRSAHLLELMRLLFCHPLWNVGEVAASELVTLIDKNPKRQAIITTLFDDRYWCEKFSVDEPYWRVRFGAIEAAYQFASMDQMALFGTAVRRFCGDRNSRVRALCAENLIAHIIDRPPSLRRSLLDEFSAAISRWLNDDDAWVLEHVFRLLNTLERDDKDFDCGTLFAPQMPYLLDGLPRSGWRNLSRAEFLTHIEAQQRKHH